MTTDMRRNLRLRRSFRHIVGLVRRVVNTVVPDPTGICVCDVGGIPMILDMSDENHRMMASSGEYEPEATHLFLKLLAPGDVFFDVGAHVGWYACVALLRGPGVERVYAYEALDSAFDLLSRNVELNRLGGRLIARYVAVSDRAGTGAIHRFAEVGSMHSSLYQLADLHADSQEITLVTLDAEAQSIDKAPAVIKVDVEGAERMVLAGAQRLSRGEFGTPPIWILEANYETAAMAGYFPWSLIDDVETLNDYRPFKLGSRAIHALPSSHSVRHGDMLVLAIPELHRERLARAGYVS